MWEKILVVDENVESRDRFYQVLSSLCYKVTCVPTGREALIRLTEARFDLIVIEENLPQEPGEETIKKIRGFDEKTKIVLVTGKEKDSCPAYIDAVVKKDFSSHFMMKTILEVLKEKRETQEAKGPAESKVQKKIMVVDDNQEIREVVGGFLAKKGYKVFTASGGEEALMQVKLDAPDLVFLDMRMPGMDGIMVLRQLKQLDSALKVVMLTSAQEEYIMQEAQREGADDYVVKPCDLAKLDILITALLLPK